MVTKAKRETGATLEERRLVLWGMAVAQKWGTEERLGSAIKHHYSDGFFKITYKERESPEDKRILTIQFRAERSSPWSKVFKAEIWEKRYAPPSKILAYNPGIWERLLHLTYNEVKREEHIKMQS